MPQAVVEGLGVLSRQGAAGGIGNGAGDHDRQACRAAQALVVEVLLDREHRRLGVEGVEDGLDQQDVRPALHQRVGGLVVLFRQFREADVAEARIVDVRRDRQGAAGRPQHPRDEARLVRSAVLVRHPACQHGRGVVDLPHQFLHTVVGHGGTRAVEGVGLDDVRAHLQVLLVDAADDLRLGQHQQVVVALQVAGPVGKALAPVIRLLQPVPLDHGAHGTVQDQDALGHQGL